VGEAPRPRTGVVLCADDFAMTEGVSRAILALAEAGRISATSAMTTFAHWPGHARWLQPVRGDVSVGLHFNLTLGAPLGPMPELAATGAFPTVGTLTLRALSARLPAREIADELTRQLDRFETQFGYAPDHIDGHQHVHALPGVRTALFEVLRARYAATATRPLLRDPSDRAVALLGRRNGLGKALILSGLSLGFARLAQSSGFACNAGFSGVTAFDDARVDADFASGFSHLGARHLMMCHPGFIDDDLRRLDPVLERRQREYDVLMVGDFGAALWRPQRAVSGGAIDWSTDWTGTR
jgi:chitin disaccharide deacetylase